jgi:Skp family chaperone for outer membrane proteins
MTRNLIAILACGALAAPATAADPLPIALVNVDRILKTHKPLQERLNPLKAEAKDLDAAVQVRQAEIETVGGRLRGVQPGSPDQQRLQLQLVKLQTDLQQFVNSERQKLQKKEVAAYLELFRQLDAEISKYAKAHDLKLVIRQYETSYDEGQPLQDILKALNRSILFEEGLDITDDILKAIAAPPAAGVQR